MEGINQLLQDQFYNIFQASLLGEIFPGEDGVVWANFHSVGKTLEAQCLIEPSSIDWCCTTKPYGKFYFSWYQQKREKNDKSFDKILYYTRDEHVKVYNNKT